MQCAVGSYVGNGVNARPIIVGWRPELVIIKSQTTAQFAAFKIADMAGDTTLPLANAAGVWANGIESLDADGFTIGDDVRVNENLIVFHWQAFRDVGGADFAHGSYVGNGADPRNVVAGLPFAPAIVVIKRDGASVGVWKPASLAGDSSLYFSAAAAAADRIQALNADGFQVGADAEVNLAANTYYWFAFAEVAGWIDVGSYVGNAPIDDRSIGGVEFPPNLVWIKAGTTVGRAVHRPSSLAGDLTLWFDNFAANANLIQALEADGFQVGSLSMVNENLITLHYAAWLQGTSPVRPVYDPLLGKLVMHAHGVAGTPVYDVLLGKLVRHGSLLTGPAYDVLLGKLVMHTHA